MSGILDGNYGAADVRKARNVKRIVLVGIAVVVAGAIAYWNLRTWGEERTVKEFLSALDHQDFQGAYKMWGCSQDHPCPNYDPQRFTEDWGPSSPYAKGSAAQIASVDFCDSGVVFSIQYPRTEAVALWVERSTKVISFAPWPRCPGPHWELKRFFKSLFTKDA